MNEEGEELKLSNEVLAYLATRKVRFLNLIGRAESISQYIHSLASRNVRNS